MPIDEQTARRVTHEWLVHDPPQVVETRAGRRVGAGMVVAVEQRTAELRRLDDHTGAQDASALTGTTAAWLASLEARALARLGRPVDVRHALDRATELREHTRADELDELGGLLTFTWPRQMYYRADTTSLLPGDAADAEHQAQDAVDAYERATNDEASFSDLAGSRTDLALARVRRHEIAGAHDALRPTLDLPPEQRIGGIIPSVLRVAHAIQTPALAGSAEIQGMQGEIEEFVRHRPPVLPQ